MSCLEQERTGMSCLEQERTVLPEAVAAPAAELECIEEYKGEPIVVLNSLLGFLEGLFESIQHCLKPGLWNVGLPWHL